MKTATFYTADKEAGNIIEKFESFEDAKKAIEAYEANDRKEGTYMPEFYDILNADKISVIY